MELPLHYSSAVFPSRSYEKSFEILILIGADASYKAPTIRLAKLIGMTSSDSGICFNEFGADRSRYNNERIY